MADFRLTVFLAVANRLNFSRAAEELFISQPAVSKHIKELENYYNCSLFTRVGNVLSLTEKGKKLKEYAEEISVLYSKLKNELNNSENTVSGFLRIGASTTAAQYVLPRYLARFKKINPAVHLLMKTDNTETIENLLQTNKIDIGIVEGKPKRNSLNYVPFKKDEIVLCTNTATTIDPVIKINNLHKLTYIIREKGSGTLDIVKSELHKNKIKLSDLKVETVLENNESIKSYLEYSQVVAFISISAIAKELENDVLKIVDIEGLTLERYFYIVMNKREPGKLAQMFSKFLLNNI